MFLNNITCHIHVARAYMIYIVKFWVNLLYLCQTVELFQCRDFRSKIRLGFEQP